MRRPLLCLDVGNTQTVLGVLQGREVLSRWRIRTDHDRTADEYAHLIVDLLRGVDCSPATLGGVVISCVVPNTLDALVEMGRDRFGLATLVVGPGMKTGLPILYDNPREVGADRIANAVAAYERFACPLVIIDFGTAITFDVVSAAGEYLGGVIAPGIGISLDALFHRAARLPRVELSKPERVVGRDTLSSIQSGVVYGYAGMVDALVRRIAVEMKASPRVVATGGMASVVAEESEVIGEVLPDLTLEGLAILWERNS